MKEVRSEFHIEFWLFFSMADKCCESEIEMKCCALCSWGPILQSDAAQHCASYSRIKNITSATRMFASFFAASHSLHLPLDWCKNCAHHATNLWSLENMKKSSFTIAIIQLCFLFFHNMPTYTVLGYAKQFPYFAMFAELRKVVTTWEW